jgi:hypothetical protein
MVFIPELNLTLSGDTKINKKEAKQSVAFNAYTHIQYIQLQRAESEI